MEPRFTARTLLEEYWDLCIPVDPEVFAECLGLKVIRSADMKLKSGYLDTDKRTIFVNQTQVSEHQRFAIARELGRFCLGGGNSPDRETDSSRCQETSDSLTEQNFNRFAVELLMPALALRALIDGRNIKDPVRLRQLLGVSSQVLSVRLQALGYFG